jgi:hypothetical protein
MLARLTFSSCSCSIVFIMFLYGFWSFACNFFFWNFACNLFLQVCAFLVFLCSWIWVRIYNYYKFFILLILLLQIICSQSDMLHFFSCFVSKLITIADVRVVISSMCLHHHRIASNLRMLFTKFSHWVKSRSITWFSIFFLTKYDDAS